MPLTESKHTPGSTYRVQLQGKFNFADLAALTPYFKELGISDLYLSPIFAAIPGSQHGYDVTDYSEVNPELGGLEALRQLAAALRSIGVGIILDFVPNHMGIAGMSNQWWRDVLEFGQRSRYAPFFDIQWNADCTHGHPQVLVPVLSDHYGRVLEDGRLTLAFEHGFVLRHGETTLPIRPESYREILASEGKGIEKTADESAVDELMARFAEGGPPGDTNDRPGGERLAERAMALKTQLQSLLTDRPALRERVEARLLLLNGTKGEAASFDPLHRILEKQHYRLVRWQTGAHEINYRRFFAIDTLVGMHMETPEVFRACHAMVLRLLESGDVAGLRIDHIDGLRQPEDYLRRIQSTNGRHGAGPIYLLTEKILGHGEKLPEGWPVHGTTGYEFIALMAGLLVDRSQEGTFDAIHRRFTGESRAFPELVYRSKRLVIAELFANAISNLGAELVQIIAGDRLWRDLTRHELTTAVSELMVHLPIGRTYRRRREEVPAADQEALERACADAIAGNPRADPQAFTFVRDLLIGRHPPTEAPAPYRDRVLGWVLTFQQYSGAIMAKAVEDMAFYNYNRLIALNEVGSDPAVFGRPIEDFHQANARRQAESPLTLLASSTHDTKLSEDVRARLYALPEIGGEWEAWLNGWRDLTAPQTTNLADGPAPDAQDQCRFFQILLGVWPLFETELDENFRRRLKDYFRKAVDESARHTSILNRNEAYLAACDRFVEAVTDEQTGRDFLETFRPCANRIARLGWGNSLTQLVLKCTLPGVPDFYQGDEIWDFRLVDPDNRRPVDYGHRRELIAGLQGVPYSTLLENWRDGRIKLRVTRELLLLRRRQPGLFAQGSYRAVATAGSFHKHVVAFIREHEGESLLVAVPRLAAGIGSPPMGMAWDDTRLADGDGARDWRDALTGRVHGRGEPIIHLRTLFADLPFAVLES